MLGILVYINFVLCIATLIFNVILYYGLEKVKVNLKSVEIEPLGRVYNTCNFCKRSLPNVYLSGKYYVCTNRVCQNSLECLPH